MDPEHHWMRERMPFAVVGSNMTITDPGTGQMYRGREYPWGCVNIEDKVGTSVLHSHWSRSNNARLLLVEGISQQFYALKPPYWRLWNAKYFACSMLVLYGIRIVGFHAGKCPIIGALTL